VEARAGTGEDPARECVESVQEKLGVGVGDADVLYEERKVLVSRLSIEFWGGEGECDKEGDSYV
jgi:hypothetical protein